MRRTCLIVLVYLLMSCCSEKVQLAYLGKWAGFSGDEYIEAYITEDTIFAYSTSLGYQGPIGFKADSDSLYYNSFDMTVGYKRLNDSVLLIGNRDFTDTMYRLDATTFAINELDIHDSVQWSEFSHGFYQRREEFFIDRGYTDQFEYERMHYDSIFEEELIID